MKKKIVVLLIVIILLQIVDLNAFAANAQYNYHVTITVENYGRIIAELYPDIAPATVENFVNLATQGFYDGLTFHRIIPGFIIQGGDPLGNSTGGSSKKIKGEFSANGVENNLKHTRGVLSMARASAYDSASSQFFIMHEDAPQLDGQYATFGRVISGMEVIDAICRKVSTVDANGVVAKENQPVISSITVVKNQISTTDKGTVLINAYEYKTLSDGTIEILDYTGNESYLTIPTHLNGLYVTKIGDYAFENCKELREISIPDSIISIGENPFSSCSLYIDISPDHPTLATIEGVLFYKPTKRLVYCPYASETSYTIPYGVKEIGSKAFSKCDSLEEISIPNSVTAIGYRAFEHCENLSTIEIPNSVVSIGDGAFYGCKSLTNLTIPPHVEKIGDYTFSFCRNIISIALSNSITSIGKRAFASCYKLESITIPNSVTYIDETAFEYSYPQLIVERNSYARQYAIDNGLLYNYPDSNDWLLQ